VSDRGRYLAELDDALRVRGRARRRFLRECADHLADAAAALDIELTADEIEALERHYVPRSPTYF